jgi:signal transduction histidine kinase
LKLAGASTVGIDLAIGADSTRLEISDDGCGFDSVSPPAPWMCIDATSCASWVYIPPSI